MTPKEAIKQLEDLQGYVFSETGHLPNDEDEMAISVLIEAFKKIQWIPCSERLPEEKGEYLVSFGKNTKTVIETFDGVYFSERNYFIQPEAWMPLPELYKEEEKE